MYLHSFSIWLWAMAPIGVLCGIPSSSASYLPTTLSSLPSTFATVVNRAVAAHAVNSSTPTDPSSPPLPASATLVSSQGEVLVPQANCTYSFSFIFFAYKIQGIQNWDTEGFGTTGIGSRENVTRDRLHHEVKGCGAVTKWKWHDDEGTGASASFQLPLLTRIHCPERAISSAGGPANGDCDYIYIGD